jgi:hypothetical protein
MKLRVSEDIDEIWSDIETADAAHSADNHFDQDDDDADVISPTYEMVLLRRANQKCHSLEEFVANARDMFKLQVRRTTLFPIFSSFFQTLTECRHSNRIQL